MLIRNSLQIRGYLVFNKIKTRLILGGLTAAAVACAATMASAAGASTAPGHVAGWVKSATMIGAAPADRSVNVAVHLALRNTADLKTLVTEVSSPTSRQYGRYLTVEEFGLRFAPAAADVNAVKAMLEHAGISD